MDLRYLNSNDPDSKELDGALAAARKQIQRFEGKTKTEPLGSYLLEEILQTPNATDSDRTLAIDALEKYGANSCPQKELLLRQLDGDEGVRKGDVKFLAKSLDRIVSFHSRSFREEALESLLDDLPVENQDKFRERLRPHILKFPKLLEDNLWILTESSAEAVQKEPQKSFAAALENSSRRRCRTAKNHLLRGLKEVKPSDLKETENVTLKLESCFRRKGYNARLRYWRQLEKPLNLAFGFPGAEIAMRKEALLRWAKDDFKSARQKFNVIIKQAQDLKIRSIEANAIFTLARIEENAGRLQESIEYYRRYATHFPQGDKDLEALMALVLLSKITGDTNTAIANAEEIIRRQSQVEIDKRSTGSLSFGLFWNARLRLEQGNKPLAMEMWRRLASEYYSTYYGALGHYMLEQHSEKAFELEPSRSRRFRAESLFEKFSPADQQTITRIEALLKYGLREEAACEIGELNTRDRKNEKILVKALLSNAAGEWLSTIKLYDSFTTQLSPQPTGGV